MEEKKLSCVICGVSTVDDEEIYFNSGGYHSMDNPSSGKIDKDSIFWICSQTKLVAHARSFWKVLTSILSASLTMHTMFLSQLAALQLIEKGKLHADTPVSTYLPVFENPIILDDITAEKPSYQPATKVVLVQHLLNFSSGLFYPVGAPVHVLPMAYLAPHDGEDPVGNFYNLIKVSPSLLPAYLFSGLFVYSTRFLVY